MRTVKLSAEARAALAMSRSDKQFLSVFLFIVSCTALFVWWHHRSADTVFVAVGAYRDKECVDTLVDLFRMSDRPENVYVGVVTYTAEGDTTSSERCEAPQLAPYETNIRRIDMSHTLSKGPTLARVHAASMYGGQKYLLQIDAHMTFVGGWDTELLRMVKSVPSKKALVTTYPASDEDLGVLDVPVTCQAAWIPGEGIVRLAAALEPQPLPNQFQPVPFAAGAFMFGAAVVLQEVPYDPSLEYLFHDEELFSARLWTSGWDFFTPDMNVLFHHYEREGPKYWTDVARQAAYQPGKLGSLQKVVQLMNGTHPQPYSYGMGTQRSLEDWWAYAGLDPLDQTANADGSRFCKSLRYGASEAVILRGEEEDQQPQPGSKQSAAATPEGQRQKASKDQEAAARLALGRKGVAGAQAVDDRQKMGAGGSGIIV